MKLFFARWLATASLAAFLAIVPGKSQAPPNPKPQDESGQPAPAKPSGKVLFQRSVSAGGETVNTTGPAAKSSAVAESSSIDDAERKSVTVTGRDLDIRLDSAAQQLAARAVITVRNTGAAPLSMIPLQLSSSFKWESIHVAGHPVSFPTATVNSDSDHTGQLHEAAIPLAQALAPGETVQLDVTYSGSVAPTARRLLSVGTPEDSASHSDWDEISPTFTGLRGFGNVVWYPVVSIPVILGDGARLFDEIGRQKLCASGTSFRLRLTVEFPHGQAPAVVVVNGDALAFKTADSKTADSDLPGIGTADTGATTLTFESPSLFVSTASAHPGKHLTIFSTSNDEPAASQWLTAATNVSPMIERWLGSASRTELTILDLPDPEDLPWESGTLLAIPLQNGQSEQVSALLAHALTHAWMAPSPYWLNEGTANFMGTLWDDHFHHRDQALSTLEAGRQALALEEPPSPGEGAGQPLALATSPVYYRTKAAYILWMLRDLVGDDALGAALRAFNGASGKNVSATNVDSAIAFQTALKTAAPSANLKWFFADWIEADHGLPDLTIERVFPNAVQSGNWLVSVTISNAGYAAAEVPITIRSATNTTTERVFVPSRGTVTPRMLVQGKPTEVQVNDGTVPETQASLHVTHLDQQPDSDPPAGAQQ